MNIESMLFQLINSSFENQKKNNFYKIRLSKDLWLKEFCTIHFGTFIKAGHTTSVLSLGKYFKICIITQNNFSMQFIKNNSEYKKYNKNINIILKESVIDIYNYTFDCIILDNFSSTESEKILEIQSICQRFCENPFVLILLH
jgi:hypothetical protein